MLKQRMMAMIMPFKEAKLDKEGNPILDKKTGEVQYKTGYRIVRHNAAFFPRECRNKAENPTC